jgi:hypothetical protein
MIGETVVICILLPLPVLLIQLIPCCRTRKSTDVYFYRFIVLVSGAWFLIGGGLIIDRARDILSDYGANLLGDIRDKEYSSQLTPTHIFYSLLTNYESPSMMIPVFMWLIDHITSLITMIVLILTHVPQLPDSWLLVTFVTTNPSVPMGVIKSFRSPSKRTQQFLTWLLVFQCIAWGIPSAYYQYYHRNFFFDGFFVWHTSAMTINNYVIGCVALTYYAFVWRCTRRLTAAPITRQSFGIWASKCVGAFSNVSISIIADGMQYPTADEISTTDKDK